MGIMDDFKNRHDEKEIKKIFDLIFDSFDKLCDQKRKMVAYLYLQTSVMENIPLVEAFKRYAWEEAKGDAGYVRRGDRMLMGSTVDCIIYLTPRKDKLSFELPYRRMAFELLEMVRKSLNVPKYEHYGMDFQGF